MIPLKPVDEKCLLGIFTGDKFKELLDASAMHTVKTGHECGFIISRDLEGKLHYSRMVEGDTDSTPDLFDPSATGINKDTHLYNVLNLHFHPGGDSYVMPSGSYGDLAAFAAARAEVDFDYRPICVVGEIGRNFKGELLLLQERSTDPLGYRSLRGLDSAIDELLLSRRITTQDAVNMFNELYKATSLQFDLDGNSLFPRGELKKIKMFAYQPSQRTEEEVTAILAKD